VIGVDEGGEVGGVEGLVPLDRPDRFAAEFADRVSEGFFCLLVCSGGDTEVCLEESCHRPVPAVSVGPDCAAVLEFGERPEGFGAVPDVAEFDPGVAGEVDDRRFVVG